MAALSTTAQLTDAQSGCAALSSDLLLETAAVTSLHAQHVLSKALNHRTDMQTYKPFLLFLSCSNKRKSQQT